MNLLEREGVDVSTLGSWLSERFSTYSPEQQAIMVTVCLAGFFASISNLSDETIIGLVVPEADVEWKRISSTINWMNFGTLAALVMVIGLSNGDMNIADKLALCTTYGALQYLFLELINKPQNR